MLLIYGSHQDSFEFELNQMASAVELDDNASFIPASQRPDGTWRKPRRVKGGYVPQDEVPLYESKGKQWASRSSAYPVGLDPALIRVKEEACAASRSPIPGLVIQQSDDGKKKKKKKSKSTVSEGDNIKVKEQKSPATCQAPCEKNTTRSALADEQAAIDPLKKIKALRKKLREIEAIEKKVSSGELKALDKDQRDKMARKLELLNELMALQLVMEDGQ